MLKIKLMRGTVLDKEATREKMEAAGFVVNYRELPEKVLVRLTLDGQSKYRTNDEAVAAACQCLVEK